MLLHVELISILLSVQVFAWEAYLC